MLAVGDDLIEPTPGTAQAEEPGTEQVSRRPRGAITAIVAAVAALVAAQPLSDNSFLTHLATGRLILADGIPESNPFLYTGTAFPVPSWGWSILLALTESVGGAAGIRVLTAVLAAALGAVLVRLTRPIHAEQLTQVRLLGTVLPAGLALLCVFQFLSGRPHLAGFLLLSLVALVWNEDRSPWWMVPVFAVWVNVHGSWLFGVAVLGLFVVSRAIDDRRIRASQVWMLAASVGGVVLGGAIYPRAFELLLLPTRQFGDPVEREALQIYREWAPPDLSTPVLWPLVALGALALWGCVRNRRWASAAATVALFALGVSGLRMVPVAAVSLVPFAASGLLGLGSLGLPVGRSSRIVAGLAGVVAAGTLVYCLVGPGYDLQNYPTDATDWLEERDLVGGDTRVMSHEVVGNYLEWRYGTEANTFVDDRPDAATFIEYRKLLKLEDDWPAALDRADPDVVVWRTKERLTAELAEDDDWTQAAEMGGFTIFCSRAVADRCT